MPGDYGTFSVHRKIDGRSTLVKGAVNLTRREAEDRAKYLSRYGHRYEVLAWEGGLVAAYEDGRPLNISPERRS